MNHPGFELTSLNWIGLEMHSKIWTIQYLLRRGGLNDAFADGPTQKIFKVFYTRSCH